MSGAGEAPVLVTGATGFMGHAVVRRLLDRGEAVIALARARPGAPARARVMAAIDRPDAAGRLVTVEGDLTRPEPVTVRDLDRLRASVRTVIHCAGDTTFFPANPVPFRAGHVDGPCALLRGLGGGVLERWVQVSTAYVCGRRVGMVCESEGDVGQEFHNPYERVKLEAETAVRAAAAAAGVDCRVLRPAIVVGAGPPTTGGHPAGVLFEFIRLVHAVGRAGGGTRSLRIAAAPRAPFNVVPVEDVAADVVLLTQADSAAWATFHVVVPDPPSQAAMLAMIASCLGVDGLRLVDAGTAGLDDSSPLERRVARRLAPYRDYLEQEVRFDDAAARSVRDRYGAPAPSLGPAAVARLVEQALGAAMPARNAVRRVGGPWSPAAWTRPVPRLGEAIS